MSERLSVTYLQCIMVMTKVKYECFEEMKRKAQKH